MRSVGGTAGGTSTRFWAVENAVQRLGATGARLCSALLIGLGLSPSAIAQTTVTYVHTDALGSVVAESDANGNVIKRFDYEPYGTVVGRQVEDGPGYAGHVSDSSTGLSYMQQRYMDPQVGMFLSIDPVTAYEQPATQFNRYRYANGNPYKFTDPDGRQSLPRSVYETDWTRTETRQAFRDAASIVADFTPVVGDAKGVIEAVREPSVINVVGATIGFVPIVGDAGKTVLRHGDEAAQLGKQLASEQQMAELAAGGGIVTHGATTKQPLRQGERLAAQHGGESGSYQKVSSSSYKAADGGHVETHAFRNAETGQIIEPKTVVDP